MKLTVYIYCTLSKLSQISLRHRYHQSVGLLDPLHFQNNWPSNLQTISVPDEWLFQKRAVRSELDIKWTISVPDEGYSRNVPYALN